MKKNIGLLTIAMLIVCVLTGSGAGIQAIQEGGCDIGLSGRDLKDEEKANGLEGTILAYDGIAIIVNPENPVSDLDVKPLQRSTPARSAELM